MRATLHIDRGYVLETLVDLVKINSINPSIAAQGAGEEEIAAYVAGSLQRIGLKASVVQLAPGRANAIGVLAGQGGGRSLMLNAHTDTVGIEGMPEPFAASIRDGRLFGRGAHDMKGSLAACMGAAKALVDAGAALGGDVVIAAVADEEHNSLGTQALLPQWQTDGAIVTEPTDLEICLAHKGFIWLEVETIGRAAHGSRFAEGIDANLRMGRVLVELEHLERALRTGPAHPLVGPPSLHASLIAGGSGLSTYAARCRLTIERRTVPGEQDEEAEAQIQTILDRLAAGDPSFRATLRRLGGRRPFEVSAESRIVQTLRAAATDVLGRAPRFVGDSPWMDSALLAEAGVDTVVIGPTGGGEHSAEEWVDIDSVMTLAEILACAALSYCARQTAR